MFGVNYYYDYWSANLQCKLTSSYCIPYHTQKLCDLLNYLDLLFDSDIGKLSTENSLHSHSNRFMKGSVNCDYCFRSDFYCCKYIYGFACLMGERNTRPCGEDIVAKFHTTFIYVVRLSRNTTTLIIYLGHVHCVLN